MNICLCGCGYLLQDSWPFPFLEITHTAHAKAGDWATRREAVRSHCLVSVGIGQIKHIKTDYSIIQYVQSNFEGSGISFTIISKAKFISICISSPNPGTKIVDDILTYKVFFPSTRVLFMKLLYQAVDLQHDGMHIISLVPMYPSIMAL